MRNGAGDGVSSLRKPIPTGEWPGRVVFAARGADVPGYKPLLGADLARAAAWVNDQPDWAPLEVVGDFMRERAVEMIAAFPWAKARTRAALERA